MRATAALLLLTTALFLAACGDDGDSTTGDDGSSAEFTAELDAACAEQVAFLEDLPLRQAEEGLSTAEAEELAKQSGDDFISGVGALEPPEDLADAHEELVNLLETPPATTSTTPPEYYGDLAEVYGELGADGCAKIAADAEELVSD